MAAPKKPTGNAGKGRQKGVPNKFTGAIKDMVLKALDEAHPEGGVGYLRTQAHENPVAFMGLVGKILPTQLEHSGAINIGTILDGLPDA